MKKIIYKEEIKTRIPHDQSILNLEKFRKRCGALFRKGLFSMKLLGSSYYYSFMTILKGTETRDKGEVLDMETYKEGDKLIPYAIGISIPPKVIGPKYKERVKELDYHLPLKNGSIIKCIGREKEEDPIEGLSKILKRYVLTTKNNGKRYGAHNGGRFDTVYILKALIWLGYSGDKLIIRKNGASIILLRVYYSPNNCKTEYGVEFSDSYMLLPSSLKGLCKLFNTKEEYRVEKLEFDHNKVLSTNYMDPEIRDEVEKYLYADVASLFAILYSAQKMFIERGGVDPLQSLTISQLAYRIFRTRYYNEKDRITILRGKLDRFVREGFYGGLNELYVPIVNNGYGYDISSHYPKCMTMSMPVGIPRFYPADKGLSGFFGFAKARITVKENMKKPCLPMKTQEERLIFGYGTGIGTYFSEELRYAESIGYKIELLECISFEKGNPFKEYVNTIYDIKSATDDHSLKYISKLLLNSLFGKTAQKPISERCEIIKSMEEVEKIYQLYTDVSHEKVCDSFMIKYNIAPNTESGTTPNVFISLGNKYMDVLETNDASAQIAAAVTAYGRIELHKVMSLQNNKVIYADTDSLFLQNPLPKKYLGNHLGAGKNEIAKYIPNYTIDTDAAFNFEMGIFLTQKVYMIKLGHNLLNPFKIAFKGINLEYENEEDLGKKFKDMYEKAANNKINIQFNQSWLEVSKDLYIVNKVLTANVQLSLDKRYKIVKNGIGVDTGPLRINLTEPKPDPDPIYYQKKVPPLVLREDVSQPKIQIIHKKIRNINIRTRSVERVRDAANKQILTEGGFKGTITVVESSYGETSLFAKSLTGFCYGTAKDAFRIFLDNIYRKTPSPDSYGGYIFNQSCEVTLETVKIKDYTILT